MKGVPSHLWNGPFKGCDVRAILFHHIKEDIDQCILCLSRSAASPLPHSHRRTRHAGARIGPQLVMVAKAGSMSNHMFTCESFTISMAIVAILVLVSPAYFASAPLICMMRTAAPTVPMLETRGPADVACFTISLHNFLYPLFPHACDAESPLPVDPPMSSFRATERKAESELFTLEAGHNTEIAVASQIFGLGGHSVAPPCIKGSGRNHLKSLGAGP